MKRALFALACAVGIAPPSGALTLTLVPDRASYLPGDQIVLTVMADPTGGAPSLHAFGEVHYDPLIMTGGLAVQSTLFSFGVLPWKTALTMPCGGGTCTGFDQLFLSNVPVPADPPPGGVLASMLFTAGAPGSTNVTWELSTFQFFGLTSPLGATVVVVPEPATAALLAFGLVVLGAARRRS